MKRGKRTAKVSQIGKNFDRRDIDRVGFFDDPPPGPFGPYAPPAKIRDDYVKGPQLIAGPTIHLFEKKFQRIFEGEALPITDYERDKESSQKDRLNLPPMLPPSPCKKHSTPGDSYGCFDKPTYFSPELNPVTRTRELPNFKIKPNPLGGPGYVDICFHPYPSHSSEPYEPEISTKKHKGAVSSSLKAAFITTSTPVEYFTPNPYFVEAEHVQPTYVRRPEKVIPKITSPYFYVRFPKTRGGNYDGCFERFPTYTSQPYEPEVPLVSEPKWSGGAPNLRTKYTTSIISKVTAISCNRNNYAEYQEQVYPLRN